VATITHKESNTKQNDSRLETHMHSLEANASPAGRLFAAKCRRRCHIPAS